MRILAVGDVVGSHGTEFIRRNLWSIRKEHKIDMTVLNGENAAKGNGLDKDTAETLLVSGADVITSGNHIWQKHEMKHYIEDAEFVLRPANYPSECPGSGVCIFNAGGVKVLVMSLLGNVYMPDAFDCPFKTAKRLLEKYKGDYDVSVIDIHAEATSEKIALAKYLDGDVSVVFGTHTHVQTNDARVLKGGTGFVTDVGMTGVYDSILGVKNECILDKFLYKMPVKFEEGDGDVMFNGCVFDIDENTGICREAYVVSFTE
ncbi:MAG: TIGR00282 family metallophosphoesterase [Clostridia bacterium]|nr:TIGR00282 family metallophosphoesterase [Clostridia bacterium]